MSIRDWWKGQFQSPASQQKSASEVTTTASQACAPSSNKQYAWDDVLRDKYFEDAYTHKKRVDAVAQRVKREQDEERKRQEMNKIDKLNDPEYVKQQYNMPLNDRQFVDWLRGAVDLVGDEPPTKEQWENIKTGIARVIAKRMLDTQEVAYPSGKAYQTTTTFPKIWGPSTVIYSGGTDTTSAFRQEMTNNNTVASWDTMRNEYVLKDE